MDKYTKLMKLNSELLTTNGNLLNEIARLVEKIEYKDKELDQLRIYHRRLFDLLAVIHRDGGHYTERHGFAQSITDATKEVAELIAYRDMP